MTQVRDLLAHVLQLCDYVEDMSIEPGLLVLIDYKVMRAKAQQVKALVLNMKG